MRKPFIEQVELPTIKSMLDPMKLRHTNKRDCHHEPMNLSIHSTRPSDVSEDISCQENSLSMEHDTQRMVNFKTVGWKITLMLKRTQMLPQVLYHTLTMTVKETSIMRHMMPSVKHGLKLNSYR